MSYPAPNVAHVTFRHSIARRGILSLAILGPAGWYLSENPSVLRAVGAVLLLGVFLSATIARRRTLGRRRRLRSLGDLLALTPLQFEEAVADLLARSSYRRVRLCGGSGDLGADIVCVDRRGREVIVQCKRHAPGIAVGSGVVQRFLGSLTHHGAAHGILVTTSRFTAPALALAAQHNIELMDGEALVRLAGRLNGKVRRSSAPVPAGVDPPAPEPGEGR
jgi:restriction system protein